MKIDKIESTFDSSYDQKCSVSDHGMVSTAFPEATEAGVRILEAGGNAVDAACASALALCVCEPQASGIAGQSMAILNLKDKVIAVDGSSRVPSLAHLSKLETDERFTGYKACTVPSTVAVLGYLNFRYGKLDWKEVVRPAIEIAENGYKITELQSRLQKRETEKFLSVESKSGAKAFLKDGKEAYSPGDLFFQTDLARTLSIIADKGPRAFYQGEIAIQIDKDMKKNDGFLRAEDLALIPWPIEREPFRRNYRSLSIYTTPPPSAGKTFLLVMMILNNLPSKLFKERSPESYHFLAEAFRKAFLLRKERPFDPLTYPDLSNKKTLTRDNAKKIALSITNTIDKSLPLIDPEAEDGDTTHLSVMDKEGNAVGITQSIERVYGSKAAADGLGFLYNNYMAALETRDPAHPYYLRPNAAPWTSVSPFIAKHKGKLWMVAGSPGSERIFSTMSLFLSHIVDASLNMGEAMRRPRLHCSIGGTISIEQNRFDSDVVKYLTEVGYKMAPKDDFSFYHGAVHACLHSYTKGNFQGVSEVRRDGIAKGPS